MIFPKIFITGELNYPIDKKSLCADGLSAWATCYFKTPPKNFGKTMVLIAQEIGCVATPSGLEKYAKKEGW